MTQQTYPKHTHLSGRMESVYTGLDGKGDTGTRHRPSSRPSGLSLLPELRPAPWRGLHRGRSGMAYPLANYIKRKNIRESEGWVGGEICEGCCDSPLTRLPWPSPGEIMISSLPAPASKECCTDSWKFFTPTQFLSLYRGLIHPCIWYNYGVCRQCGTEVWGGVAQCSQHSRLDWVESMAWRYIATSLFPPQSSINLSLLTTIHRSLLFRSFSMCMYSVLPPLKIA